MSHTSRRKIPKRQRGTVLIIAMSVIVMMTLVGVMVMQVVAVDVDAVGAERGGDQALYIAEAGIQWALQEIDNNDNYSIDPNDPDWTPLTITTEGGTLVAVPAEFPWGPSGIVDWGQLHPTSRSIAYGAGAFRVVVQPANAPETGTLLIRSLGVTLEAGRYGARRLLEVAVTPQ